MQFEFDAQKSESNVSKHGIDFEEAQDVWLDPFRVEFKLECKGENRFGTIGRLSDGHWTAIFTHREKKIRLISVRRSTKKEVALYDKAANNRYTAR